MDLTTTLRSWRIIAVFLVLTKQNTMGAPVNSATMEISDDFLGSELTRHERASPNLAVKVQIQADPEIIEMRHGQTISIRCSAQADLTINDFQYVSFYRQFGEYTHMPLSSGDPGVKVEPDVPNEDDFKDFEESENEDVVKTVRVLTLGPQAFYSLDNGQNMFYCKSQTMSGVRRQSYFIVKKIVPRIPPRHRPFLPFQRRHSSRG